MDAAGNENAAGHGRALYEVHHTGMGHDAAILDQGEDAGHGVWGCFRTYHTATHRHAAGGIGGAGHLEHGLGAVDVAGRLIGILVCSARRFRHRVGRGVRV